MMPLLRINHFTLLAPFRLRARLHYFPVGKSITRSGFSKFSFGYRPASTVQTPQHAARKPVYPVRLLIFHAGTGRAVFLGCLKVTTIFLFALFGLVAAPAQLNYPNSDTSTILKAIGVFGAGMIPLVFVAKVTSPFVTHLHLRLPVFARQSREALSRYVKSLPPDAEYEITTMSLIGFPRISQVKAKDLLAGKPKRFQISNYGRRPLDNVSTKKRAWYARRPLQSFAILPTSGKLKDGWVWEEIMKRSRKSS